MSGVLAMFSGLTKPQTLARIHLWLTIAFTVLVPLSFAFGWVKSVVFVSGLSLWALVSGHWSAWQASRVEVVQDEDADVQDVLDAVRESNRLIKALIDALQEDCDDDKQSEAFGKIL